MKIKLKYDFVFKRIKEIIKIENFVCLKLLMFFIGGLDLKIINKRKNKSNLRRKNDYLNKFV